MKMLLPLALFGIASLAGYAAAQDNSGTNIDLDAVRASADAYRSDAEALADSVRTRADKVREQAAEASEQARLNQNRYAETIEPQQHRAHTGPFDFDRMVLDRAAAERAHLGNAPRFIAFASLSMPPVALQALVRDMHAAGGVTVLRGFPDGSAKKLTSALQAMAGDGAQLSGLGIDPRLFRAFAEEAAPTFIMASSDFELCDGLDCLSSVPPHDRMTGNVSVAYALEQFASGGGAGAALARLHLTRLQTRN